MSYFSEPLTHSKNNKEVKIDLSNYVTKSDLKNATGGDTSGFPKAQTKIFNNREPPSMNNKVKTMIQEKKIISFIWKIKVMC